jgi:YegS/Rv2252/BmrU family lipid kinase
LIVEIIIIIKSSRLEVKTLFSFIVNPTAGQGKAMQVWQQLEKHLQTRKVEYNVQFTKHAGDATSLAEQVCRSGNSQAVIAIGGDGTLHEVANGILGMDIPLGYIPAGTGNDFARSTGIPHDPVRALERILSFTPKKIDVAQINGKRFLCNA